MAGQVRRVLRRRGAPPAIIDDALQEAALRAWSHPGGFDGTEGLLRWVTVVAWRQVVAEWRRRARVEPGAVPEQPGGADPASIAEDRRALGAVREALARLSHAERDAILARPPSDTPTDDAERARIKMRRHRARQHLADLVAASGDLRR